MYIRGVKSKYTERQQNGQSPPDNLLHCHDGLKLKQCLDTVKNVTFPPGLSDNIRIAKITLRFYCNGFKECLQWTPVFCKPKSYVIKQTHEFGNVIHLPSNMLTFTFFIALPSEFIQNIYR